MEAMNQAVNAATTPAVQMWMNWILIIFALSLVFVWKNPPARWVLAAFVGSTIGAIVTFEMTQNVWLLGISHLIFWTPLAAYLWENVVKRTNFSAKSAYGIWIILILITIIISLLFDVRDVALALIGSK